MCKKPVSSKIPFMYMVRLFVLFCFVLRMNLFIFKFYFIFKLYIIVLVLPNKTICSKIPFM